MNWQLIIGSGGIVGLGLILYWIGRGIGRIETKIESTEKKLEGMKNEINERFSKVDVHFKAFNERFSGMEAILRSIDSRVSRFEGKDEERFRNEIKLMIKEKVNQ